MGGGVGGITSYKSQIFKNISSSVVGNRGPGVLALPSEGRYLYDNDGFRANDAGCHSVLGIR